MIGKVVRGNDIGGLLRYLFGPGRANEHTDPHVVAAWDDGVVAAHTPRNDQRLKRLTALLEQPLAALDNRPSPAVWHCPLRTAPADRELTDAEWADVAAEVLHQTGLAPRGDASACRWVAVRHADDHIHLAVTLARQDGRRARTPHDYARLGAACRTVELRYGLTVTPARDRTAPKQPTRAERERAARTGYAETTRERLRREVRRAAISSDSLDTFIANLNAVHVRVRLRYSEECPTMVTGYSVTDKNDRASNGDFVWFGGAKLAPSLSLPRLTRSWSRTPAEREAGQAEHYHTAPEAYTMTQMRQIARMVRHLEDGNIPSALAAAVTVVTKSSTSSARHR